MCLAPSAGNLVKLLLNDLTESLYATSVSTESYNHRMVCKGPERSSSSNSPAMDRALSTKAFNKFMKKLTEIQILLPYASLKTSAKTKSKPTPVLKNPEKNQNKTKIISDLLPVHTCLCP